jgi:hypothetical protein
VDLDSHSPIRLHGVVLNLLSIGTTLPLWCNIRNHSLESNFLQIFGFSPSLDLMELQQELKLYHTTVFPQNGINF